jgi:hypothetical protein
MVAKPKLEYWIKSVLISGIFSGGFYGILALLAFNWLSERKLNEMVFYSFLLVPGAAMSIFLAVQAFRRKYWVLKDAVLVGGLIHHQFVTLSKSKWVCLWNIDAMSSIPCPSEGMALKLPPKVIFIIHLISKQFIALDILTLERGPEMMAELLKLTEDIYSTERAYAFSAGTKRRNFVFNTIQSYD